MEQNFFFLNALKYFFTRSIELPISPAFVWLSQNQIWHIRHLLAHFDFSKEYQKDDDFNDIFLFIYFNDLCSKRICVCPCDFTQTQLCNYHQSVMDDIKSSEIFEKEVSGRSNNLLRNFIFLFLDQ